MFQESSIVSFREICPVMGSSRFLPLDSGVGDGFCDIEHEVQLERSNEFCVVNVVLVLDDSILESLFQFSNFSTRFFERVFVAVYSDMFLHGHLHVGPNAGYSLALLVLEKLVEDSRLLSHGQSLNRVSKTRIVLPQCESGSGFACFCAENETFS